MATDWKAPIKLALDSAGDRPYVVLVVDVPLPPGQTRMVSEPRYWIHSNLTEPSAVMLLRRVANEIEDLAEKKGRQDDEPTPKVSH